ncbi:putative transcription factor bHLH family [Helianthus annuus]|nr:putative transcription factor bHLH family [Helianthus annuus]KAJ0637185.1 putative transcription factor bHLH family [Helianthus annuus]
MESNQSSSSSRVDRRTIEKNRRIYMKALYNKLHSLVPHESSRVFHSLSPPQYIYFHDGHLWDAKALAFCR